MGYDNQAHRAADDYREYAWEAQGPGNYINQQYQVPAFSKAYNIASKMQYRPGALSSAYNLQKQQAGDMYARMGLGGPAAFAGQRGLRNEYNQSAMQDQINRYNAQAQKANMMAGLSGQAYNQGMGSAQLLHGAYQDIEGLDMQRQAMEDQRNAQEQAAISEAVKGTVALGMAPLTGGASLMGLGGMGGGMSSGMGAGLGGGMATNGYGAGLGGNFVPPGSSGDGFWKSYFNWFDPRNH